ncbi:MAG: hypothetical protein KA175_09160 [Flavobacteriales bacterium]|nr:hypothetical protein [Flavobacteriales bacterium]MBP6697774.1 hypothetical protein [Flavobacteriales bacterium]
MFSTNYRPLLVCLMLAPFNGAAQNENKWWFFGEAGVDFNGPQPIAYFNSAMDQTEGSASISDDQGNLLFYTDGVQVWNRNDQAMPNGSGLMGHSSSTQSALIVPRPSACGLYYIFTTYASCIGTPLHYSVVDMSWTVATAM